MQIFDDNSIRIHPVGGLGNQLFIWAAGLSLARRTGLPLEVDVSQLRTDPKRQPELLSFDSGCRVVTPDQPKRRSIRAKGRGSNRSFFAEHSYRFDHRYEDLEGPVDLSGYFQSWRYFHNAQVEIVKRINAITTPTEWFLERREELFARNEPVLVVHVRFGDYLEPQVAALHGQSSLAYYRRALGVMSDLGINGRVLAFSDDTRRAQEWLGNLADAKVVAPPVDSPPIESLALMGHCDAHILGNSTFGWWGATLARPGRLGPVIAPRPWFGTLAHDTRDLLWPEWLTVERRDFT